MKLIPRIQEGGVFKNKQAINNPRHKEQLQDSKDFDVYHFHRELILTGRLQTDYRLVVWSFYFILRDNVKLGCVQITSSLSDIDNDVQYNHSLCALYAALLCSALHTGGERRFNEWLTVIITSQQSTVDIN